MTYTPDQVAQAIIEEGRTARSSGPSEVQHPVITPRGIQIALSTAIVETNDRDLANPNVPESENYPNDGDGHDHASAGPFQQQYMWWGTVAEEMDLHLSAAMFYKHLAGMNYNDPNTSPGTFAQDVQQSAFPDRYDAAFGRAVDQYNRLSGEPVVTAPTTPRPDFNEYARFSPNSESRDGTPIDLWLYHTEQGHFNDPNAANDLADFLDNPASQVSYHYDGSMNHDDGGVTIIDVVDTDLASWSVLSANKRSIDFVVAGSDVNWTRDQWMANSKVLDAACYICAQDHIKYPSLLVNGRPRVIAPDPNDTNLYHSDPPGISDHKYVTKYLHDGTHSDVGPNFPWDYVEERTNYWFDILKGVTTPPVVTPPVTSPPVVTPPPPPAYEYPSTDEMIKQIFEQLFGPEAAGHGYRQLRYPDLHGRSQARGSQTGMRVLLGVRDGRSVQRRLLLRHRRGAGQDQVLPPACRVSGRRPSLCDGSEHSSRRHRAGAPHGFASLRHHPVVRRRI
jgi:hypothetical protein